jgi:hypothetical protein
VRALPLRFEPDAVPDAAPRRAHPSNATCPVAHAGATPPRDVGPLRPGGPTCRP